MGHYGQLGPLTRQQIDELVRDGVILAETYVWRAGMTDWVRADHCQDLLAYFAQATPYMSPPPAPNNAMGGGMVRPMQAPQEPFFSGQTPQGYNRPSMMNPYYERSDKSKIAAGVLQLLLPGVGRLYLGYVGLGILQLLACLCGFGVIWAWLDAVYILCGGVKIDGSGRHLPD